MIIGGLDLAFYLLAALTVGSALMVLLLRDLFRAALFLITFFLGIAGLYITLQADFLAAVQVLIYVGAVAVLILFAIFFTRQVQQGNPPNRFRWPALVVAALVFIALAGVLANTPWAISQEAPPAYSTGALADALFHQWVLPFEIASVLLLAALVGAIALGKEE